MNLVRRETEPIVHYNLEHIPLLLDLKLGRSTQISVGIIAVAES